MNWLHYNLSVCSCRYITIISGSGGWVHAPNTVLSGRKSAKYSSYNCNNQRDQKQSSNQNHWYGIFSYYLSSVIWSKETFPNTSFKDSSLCDGLVLFVGAVLGPKIHWRWSHKDRHLSGRAWWVWGTGMGTWLDEQLGGYMPGCLGFNHKHLCCGSDTTSGVDVSLLHLRK